MGLLTLRLLSIESLTVSFDGCKAVDGLSMTIADRELRVIIGPNGAGKKTLLDIICGKVRPASGSISLRDVKLTRLPEFEIVRRGVGRKIQTSSIHEDLTFRENLVISIPQAYGVWASILFRRTPEVRERIGAVAKRVTLGELLQAKAGRLSHGQKHRLEIGMLLMQGRSLMLLDEPVAGMSAREREVTAELLRRITGSRALMVIEHDMGFVRSIAHRVTVLHQGRLLAEEGSMDSVQADPRVIDVYLGH